MSWTTPITWTAGAIVTKAQLDGQLRDNMNFLYAATHDYVLVADSKSSGTNGGGFTSGAWRTRDLTTILSDDGGIASLSSHQLTLQPGTYLARISCPASSGSSVAPLRHQARLQNISAGTTLQAGTVESILSSSGVSQYETNRSHIVAKFTLLVASVLEVQHRCEQTVGTTGFGVAGSFGGAEVYTLAEFLRISE